MRCPLLIASVLAVAACGKGKGPAGEASCDQVATHVSALAKADVAASATLSRNDRAEITTALGPLHDSLAARCTEQAWPALVRTCMQAAETGVAVRTCAEALSPAQRGLLLGP